MSHVNKFNDAVNTAIAKQNWSCLRQLVLDEMAKNRDGHSDHWLLDRLSLSYYEERDYKSAYKVIKEAEELAPECPLVLWDLAGTLDMLGDKSAAIDIWRRLIKRGYQSVASDECGEGIRWAKSLLNDCRYRVAISLWDIGDVKQAYREMQQHLKHRSPGIPSVYPIQEARAELEKLSSLSSAVKKETLQIA